MKKNYLKTMVFALGLLGWSATVNAQYYSEGFESGAFPSGWVLTNGTYDWQVGDGTTDGPGAAHTGTYAAYFDDYNYTSGTTADMITPNIDLSLATAPQLKFWYWDGDGSDVVEVLVSTDGVTYTSIFTTPSTVSSWTKYTIDLTAYAGNTTVTVAFRGNSVYGLTNPNVDDIAIDEIPTCPQPTALVLAGQTTTTSDLAWTEAGAAISWQTEYGTTGFTQGTGTISIESNDTATVATTSNSDYDFYVRAICGPGDTSLWSGPFSFHTGYCTSLPTSHDNSGISNIMVGATNFPGTSIEYLDFTTGTVEDLAQNVNANLQITFATGFTYDANVWVDFNDNFVFEASELVFQGTSTNANPTTLDASFPMPGTAPLGNHNMRIGTADGGQATPNPCYSGGYGVTADFIINVIAAPACLPVTLLSTTAISSNTADISWTAGGLETTWNIEWGAPGFAPGTGTEAGAATFPSTAYQITGLTANTSYDVYVQADCGGDVSTWVGPLTITTGQIPVTVFPYIQDWETGGTDWSLNNATQVNKWVVGTAVANGGTQSLYISNDGGTSYSYNTASTSATHSFRDFSFPAIAPEIKLIFDWKAVGETTNWDKLRVFITPTSYIPTPGTKIITSGTAPTGIIQIGSVNYNDNNSFTTENLTIPTAYAGNNARIILEWSNDGGGGSNPPAAVDNFKVIVLTCPDISGLAVDNFGLDTIQVSWTAGGIETSWNVEWGAPGFAPGTGAQAGAGTSPTTTYTIHGLAPSSDYDIYVQADCSGGDYSYWTLVQGTTLCAPISALPWTEDFDAMTVVDYDLYPNCWVSDNGDWFTDNEYDGTSYTNPNNVSIYYDGDDYLWTPEFNLTAGTTYEFAFRWIGDGYDGWDGGIYYSSTQSSSDAVQIGTNFISNTNVSSSTDYKKEIYCFTPTTSGVYSFGVYVTSNYNPYILSFDNFSLRIPSANAGTNGATTVCQTGGLIDLNSVITISDTTGIWAFSPNPSAITSDTLFNPASISSGTTNVYYIVGGCIPDSALATINIYPKSNAGTDGTVSTCNYGPLNLFDGLTGNVDLGGQWYNPASQPISGSTVNFNGEIAANYNYIYVVNNGVCPNDTSVIEIQLQDCAGVDEYELKGFVLYPNPSNGIIHIQYSGKGEDVKLDVVDAKGAIVWSKQIQFNDGTTQTIDLSTVENGVYYINMTSKNGGSVMKVIKS